MIKYNGKQYRNLEEQVEWNKNEIEKLESANGLLGIRVVGQIESVEDLPAEDSEEFAELLYGDTYIVGVDESSYNYYVKTRPNEETSYPHWFNIGNIAPKMVVIAGEGEGAIITEGNEAAGDKAVAFGNDTSAIGDAATSLGTNTVATGPASLATGEDGEANGEASFITGSLFYNGTTPDLTHPHKANGDADIVGGMGNKSDGDATLVMGSKNITDNANSIITGVGNEVIDEGDSNIIGGSNNDVSTVDNTIIAGAGNDVQNVQDSIIVGNGNESQNESGHKVVILGSNNETVDSTAALIGNNLSVTNKNNVVILGKYNDPDTIEADDVLVVGGGVSESTRKNIFKVNTDGEIVFENDTKISPTTISTIWNSIEDKQDKLTFDNAPTSGSTNPVTSNGIYQAIQDVAGDYVTFDDIANTNALGIVKVDGLKGISVVTSGDEKGKLRINYAQETEILNSRNNGTDVMNRKPIVPSKLDYAVKTALTSNRYTLTSAEKTAAKNWLGIGSGADKFVINATSLDPVDGTITAIDKTFEEIKGALYLGKIIELLAYNEEPTEYYLYKYVYRVAYESPDTVCFTCTVPTASGLDLYVSEVLQDDTTTSYIRHI